MMDGLHPAAERLEAFAEGTLFDGERAVLESHLLGCPGCQGQVEEWRALFAALSGLPQFEPRAGFADRVMAGVSIRTAGAQWWQRWAAMAADTAARLLPKTSFGWALTTAILALPVLLGGGTAAWYFQNTSLTPDGVWALASTWMVEGLQGVGSTALTAVMRTDVAVYLAENGTSLLSRVGMGGMGVLAAALGSLSMLSGWVLYRNLFRTPRRESNHVSYSF